MSSPGVLGAPRGVVTQRVGEQDPPQVRVHRQAVAGGRRLDHALGVVPDLQEHERTLRVPGPRGHLDRPGSAGEVDGRSIHAGVDPSARKRVALVGEESGSL